MRRTYTDQQLEAAVAESRSWRMVLSTLGLRGTSAGSKRSVQRHADRLGLDYGHFTGQRKWSDRDLATAIATNFSWHEVTTALGLASTSSNSIVRGHAVRLGLDTRHLERRSTPGPLTVAAPQRTNLARAGTLLAAAWFELTGSEVSWPLEPCRYDLLVMRERRIERIQVKTTTYWKAGSWQASLRCTANQRGPYDPDDIDQFFIVDGDLVSYLVPIQAVAGRGAIQLSAYQAYRLPPLEFSASGHQ
jgi:hypothetical protein